MARLHIRTDERYPEYREVDPDAPHDYSQYVIDVDDTTAERWRAARAAFEAAQDEIAEAIHAQR